MPGDNPQTTLDPLPWRTGILSCWAIVGMNHYFIPGTGRCLFVAMSRFDRLIKAEGPDVPELWADLERQAEAIANG